MTSRRILLVSYFYPPGRDTGALRPATMVKYLRRLGHDVEVLTTCAFGSDGAAGVHRARDAQLWRARRAGREQIGALFDSDTYGGKPHLLSRLIVPDPLALAWAPFARHDALRLHRAHPFECVITTSPPESVHAVGMALHRRGAPWVADVRDAWTFEPLRPGFPTGAQRALDRRLERGWLGMADVVVCVSEPAAADLRRRGIADPVVITNGWDPEAAPQGGGAPPVLLDPDRVSLLYTGRFGSYGRDPRAMLDGLARVASEDPEIAARLELVVAGPLTEGEAALFRRDVSPARIVLAGSLPREAALALQREADALLLIAQAARSQLLNVKLFEYLASGTPVLALAAGTAAGRIVESVGGQDFPDDVPEAIAVALRELVTAPPAPPAPAALDPYTYPAPAERMAEAIERAIGRHDPRRH